MKIIQICLSYTGGILSGNTMPDIKDYSDYRLFLKDYLAFQKQSTPGFSVRSFSIRVLNHPSLLGDIIKGRRPMSENNRIQLIQFLKLSSKDKQYLETMILHNQAKGEAKKHYYQQLIQFKDTRARVLHKNEHKYFSKWYYQVLFNYFACEKNSAHPTKIQAHLHSRLSLQEIEEGIQLLLDLGLIVKRANGYQITQEHVLSGQSFDREAALSLNKSSIEVAKQCLEKVPEKEAMYSAQVFATNASGFNKIRERLFSLQEEFRKIVEANKPEKKVYTLNIQLFPNCDI